MRGLRGEGRRSAIRRVVELCHLESVLGQTIDTLSKGFRHRTCLAQALIHDPEVLILDEPTDGLDPNQKHEVRTLIRRMGETKAIIFSTHILEEVEAACTRAIIIDRGRIVANGTPEELKARSTSGRLEDFFRSITRSEKRELAAYFESPVAYVFLVIFLLLAGFFTFTFGGFFERGEASLAAFFNWLPWLFLFLVPAAGMRLWSEERRLGTIELLLTMPVATWQAILGKFLASWLFLVIALALTFPIVITANWLGDPDNGVIASGYVGAALLAGAYLAVSCMTSALTRNQVIAFILAVVLCLLLILVGFSPLTDLLARWASPWLVEAVTKFSVLTHYDGFQKGVLESRDLLYFLSVMAFTLFATGVVIRSHRAG